MNTLAAGRFVLHEKLGSGSFGEVFRAHDAQENQHVALKRLHRTDVESIARFKAEFRSVAAIGHPNLVALHGLHHDGDTWFFTMELVQGETLDGFVGGDDARLRQAFAGIARGLGALHANGHVHRDLKPSNVIVAADGRAVVLDFGLVAQERATHKGIIGSPRYIAPELTEGAEPTPASDWYSLGVMLYELLASAPPFEGRPIQVLVQKRTVDAPRLDHPLGELVASLLSRDPTQRPSLDTLLEAFDAAPSSVPHRLIGRASELVWLGDAYDRVMRGESVRCLVRAEAGAGKSFLLRHFMRTLPRDCWVLYGRCYERESVPYKGVDAIIESLADKLVELSESDQHALAPAGLPSLLALFGSLGRVPAFASARRSVGFEQRQVRAEAFGALRDLLSNVAQQWPVVWVLDDLQWSDEDAAALLQELLSEPLPILFVGTQRPGAVFSWLEADVRDLSALTMDQSRELARSLHAEPARERSIALAAGGNPLLVELLARNLGAEGLTDAVSFSLREVDPSTQQLMRAVCLAGHPIERSVARAAAGGGRFESLRRLQLVREGALRVEAYHDRIRESVVANLSEDERTHLHARLADAMADACGDPESIAHHQRRAGRTGEAAHWTLLAARRAEVALAWERAARLYREADQMHATLGLPRADVLVSLGDALANAGRGYEANEAYRRALPLVEREASQHAPVDVWRRSAEHLLRIGRMDEGLEALEEAAGIYGIRVPKRPATSLAALVAERARLAVRGLEFSPVDSNQIAPERLSEIDLCFGAGVGLSTMDSIRGAWFLARSLRQALDVGDAHRIARSMAYEASSHSNQGPPTEARSKELVRQCERLAADLDDPHLRAVCIGARCLIAFHNARWQQAYELGREAELAFRRDLVGMVKEVSSMQLYSTVAALNLGHLGQLHRRLDALVREAAQRRDLYTQVNLRSGFLNARWLVQDDPARARAEVDAARRDWDPGYYTVQRFFDFFARVQIELYRGHGMEAAARARGGYPAFRRSMLGRVMILRVFTSDLVGRAALAESCVSARRASLQVARREERRLRREGIRWADALAAALRAGICRVTGERVAAERALLDAIVMFDDLGMAAHSASARLQRARWFGGSTDEARAELSELGVQNPVQWTRMLLPA